MNKSAAVLVHRGRRSGLRRILFVPAQPDGVHEAGRRRQGARLEHVPVPEVPQPRARQHPGATGDHARPVGHQRPARRRPPPERARYAASLAPPSAPAVVNTTPAAPSWSPTWSPPAVLPQQPNWSWTTISGETYNNVRVISVDRDSVMITHATGGERVPLAYLPSYLQKLFNYMPPGCFAGTVPAASSPSPRCGGPGGWNHCRCPRTRSGRRPPGRHPSRRPRRWVHDACEATWFRVQGGQPAVGGQRGHAAGALPGALLLGPVVPALPRLHAEARRVLQQLQAEAPRLRSRLRQRGHERRPDEGVHGA